MSLNSTLAGGRPRAVPTDSTSALADSRDSNSVADNVSTELSISHTTSSDTDSSTVSSSQENLPILPPRVSEGLMPKTFRWYRVRCGCLSGFFDEDACFLDCASRIESAARR